MNVSKEVLEQVSAKASFHYSEHRRLESEQMNNPNELDEFQYWLVRADANTIRFMEHPKGSITDSYSEYGQIDQYEEYLGVLKQIAGRVAVDSVELMVRRRRALLDAERHFRDNNEAYVSAALADAAFAHVNINYPDTV